MVNLVRNDGSQRTGQVVPIRYNKRLDIMLLEVFDYLMDNCGLSVKILIPLL